MNGSGSAQQHVDTFQSPALFLADLDPETTGRVIASAADVALVIQDGVIKDISLGNEELTREDYASSWRDRPWIETVTVESRPKIEDLLEQASSTDVPWRQVNHPSSGGIDVPIRYTAVKTGTDRIVALGRDLRSVSRLQQRLVEAHQHLERDYSRLREAEARYRLLFQAVSQPVLIVDPVALRIEEANPAAARAVDEPLEALAGASLPALFAGDSADRVAGAVAEATARGEARAGGLRTRDDEVCDLVAAAFREAAGTRVIVRLRTERATDGEAEAGSEVLDILETLPDGLLVAGPDLRILAGNRAFAEMAQLTGEGQLVGGHVSDFLGRSPTEVNVLVSNLRSHGVVRNFATVLRDRFGSEDPVEISAVAAPAGSRAAYGFSVRNVARSLRTATRVGGGLPSTTEQLTELVGRVPLKEIVRESTDLIEKLCIEAALQVTGDNRASAADMLGLSRQSLYSKLKRFSMDDSR